MKTKDRTSFLLSCLSVLILLTMTCCNDFNSFDQRRTTAYVKRVYAAIQEVHNTDLLVLNKEHPHDSSIAEFFYRDVCLERDFLHYLLLRNDLNADFRMDLFEETFLCFKLCALQYSKLFPSSPRVDALKNLLKEGRVGTAISHEVTRRKN